MTASYGKVSDVVATVSPRTLRAAHPAHTGRLAEIATRIRYPGRPVPGLTTHQAKGREWEVVEVRQAASEREALAAGLDVRGESHRQLDGACARAPGPGVTAITGEDDRPLRQPGVIREFRSPRLPRWTA